MQFKVNVSVELFSGAKVALTEPQIKKVETFVAELITGTESPKEKRVYKRAKTWKGWTEQEDELVRSIMNYPRGKQRNLAVSYVQKKIGRSRVAIHTRLCNLNKQNRRKLRVISTTGLNNVHISGTSTLV